MRKKIFVCLSLIFTAVLSAQDVKTNDEIAELKKRISELESTLSEFMKGQTSTKNAVEDSTLLQELAEELNSNSRETTAMARQSSGKDISQETRKARGNFFQGMNPNISVVGSMLGSATSFDGVNRNVDLSFEEAEFAFQAAVDPYAKADFYVAFGKHTDPAVHPAGDVHEAGEEEGGGLSPEIEEAYVTILSLPFSTQLKAGRFRSNFGKLNQAHPHTYDFVTVPLLYTNFFGVEGLVDEGVGLSWLLPNALFFQELTLQVTAGPSENASFTRASNNHLLYLAHLKNFFDVSESTTLELGVTGMTGPNSEAGQRGYIFAGDITAKWKPLQHNRYKSFEFKAEVLASNRDVGNGEVNSIGFYSHFRYQFAKRWFIGGLFDYAEYPQFSDVNRRAFSGILQFFATEFQKVDLQYRYNSGNFFNSFSEFFLRLVFVIGAHGAHQY